LPRGLQGGHSWLRDALCARWRKILLSQIRPVLRADHPLAERHEPDEIDRINVYQATLAAMALALGETLAS
jgi:DNA-binding transcriptional LysR family regulator